MALDGQLPDRGQYLSLVDKNTREEPSYGLFTSTKYCFDELFLKKVMNRAQELKYFSNTGKLHVIIFRRFVERLFDLLDERDPNVKVEEFGAKDHGPYLNWTDIRDMFEPRSSIEDNDDRPARLQLPEVDLTFAERCNFVFEGTQGQGGSWASTAVTAIVFMAILANVLEIFGVVGEDVGFICCIIFSIEYLCKFLVAPFCRYSIFHEDWLLEKTVPDPKDAEAALPAGMTKSARLFAFVTHPMHVIDLVSILPTWLEPLLEKAPINLQFLRALRLFRLFRVLKFGKFSSTLSVLFVTLGNSVQAIGVLCLYIAMISMLAGAVIQQFEYPPEEDIDEKLYAELEKSFGSVPMAMKWVAGRMVTMQHSLPEKKALPQHLVSAFIVICLGLFKGVIFVLPIATITEAYKKADQNLKAQQKLQRQVEEDKIAPLGTEWCKDPNAPSARIEVYDDYSEADSSAVRQEKRCAIGSFNLPFYVKVKGKESRMFWVPLIGSLKGMFAGRQHPGVYVKVDWVPAEDSKPELRLPKGKLTVTLKKGANFKSSAGKRWTLTVEVPVRLYPEGDQHHLQKLEFTQRDDGEMAEPTFEQSQEFDVRWFEKDTSQKEEVWQRKVLDMLQKQGDKLNALESKVSK